MSSQTILYDLPSHDGKAWSLNPWKTRLILNYKAIPYTTTWIEYPNLAPTLQSLGVPANSPTDKSTLTPYSSPAIKYAEGDYEINSWPIAHTLEQRYPSPSLHLSHPIVEQVRVQIDQLRKPIEGLLIPKVPALLNDVSAGYFLRTRAVRYGKSLSEVAREAQLNVENQWEEAKGPARKVGKWLRAEEGAFFLGAGVSYADFIFVAFLHFIKRVDEGVFEQYLGLDPSFGKLYETCGGWLVRDD